MVTSVSGIAEAVGPVDKTGALVCMVMTTGDDVAGTTSAVSVPAAAATAPAGVASCVAGRPLAFEALEEAAAAAAPCASTAAAATAAAVEGACTTVVDVEVFLIVVKDVDTFACPLSTPSVACWGVSVTAVGKTVAVTKTES